MSVFPFSYPSQNLLPQQKTKATFSFYSLKVFKNVTPLCPCIDGKYLKWANL